MATNSGTLCAVEGCRSSRRRDKNLSFFHLPADEKTRKTWTELIKRPDLARPGTKRKSHFVCSLHFEPSVIRYKAQLLPKALPTISIPVVPQPTTSNRNKTETKDSSTQTENLTEDNISAVTYTHVVKNEDIKTEP
ncbi:THAP domain-containing protein [Phthorimaea operculella]|nr:THAP domain-containing protein [Phthorimaea operculella]